MKTDQLGKWRCPKNYQEDRQMMRSLLMILCGVFEAELLVYYQRCKFPLLFHVHNAQNSAHARNARDNRDTRLCSFVSRAYENTGHFASREGISRDAGHMGRNTGCPGKYGTVGNPIQHQGHVNTSQIMPPHTHRPGMC